MFKHILIPTDGSALSGHAARAGAALARKLGARITAVCVVRPLRQEFYGEEISRVPHLARIERNAREAGLKHAERAGDAARRAGVPYEAAIEKGEPVYQAIVDAARRRGCDLIVIPSHGRTGLKRLLLGSVASQVVTHSHVPVLVYRR